MRRIRKSQPPEDFIRCKADAARVEDLRNYPGDYTDLLTSEAKRSLQDYLCKEQGDICCYCMRRIAADHKHMRVEHWACQADNRPLKFEYSNMLAACTGNEGAPSGKQHCDVKKANLILKFNPANCNIEAFIQYTGSGVVKSQDPEFDEQLNTVLNLNLKSMKNDRKRRWHKAASEIKSWSKPKLEQKLAEYQTPDASGKYHEYTGVVIYQLKKKIRQLERAKVR